MLTQKKIKLIQSLRLKKFRQKYNLFVVEGNKLTQEIVKSNYIIEEIFSIKEINGVNTVLITSAELNKISFLKNPPGVLALVKIPLPKLINNSCNTLFLEDIQDPGNLGTIIRNADWFGISQIIASKKTVDIYNPKVIQASMGSLVRINIFYENLLPLITNFNGKIYTADMNGISIYKTSFTKPFGLILGNEGAGVTQNIKSNTKIVSIPRAGKLQQTQSLNVSVASGIILAECFKIKQ